MVSAVVELPAPPSVPFAVPQRAAARGVVTFGCLLVTVGAGAGITVRPKLTLVICLGLGVMAWVAMRPALAGYLVIGVTPLVAGIDRGHVVPVLRPSEALAVAVGAALALRTLVMWRSGVLRAPRLSRLEWAIVLMAVCNSIVPMIWMTARQEPITQDDILYALVLWKYAGIYLIVKTSIRTAAQVMRCLWLAVGSGALVAIIAILQSLHLFGVPALLASYYAPFGYTGALEHARGSSTLALPAATADLMILCLAVTAGLWRQVRGRRLLLSAAAALFAMGALAAGEFSSAIGLIVGICALALITNYPRLLSLLIPLAGAAVIFLRPVIAARLSGFDSVSGLPVSWTGRLHNLESYFWPKLFSDWNYLFGVRPSARVPVSFQATGYVWIESGYTWLLWGGGIPLLIAYLFFAHTALRMGWQGARHDRGPSGVAALAAFVIMTAICVVMVFDPHLTYRGIAEELYALLALAALATTQNRPSPPAAQADRGAIMIENTQRRFGETSPTPVNGHSAWPGEREPGGLSRSPAPSTARWTGGARGLIRSRWRWISLIALVVVASAAALSWSRTPTYVSGADVLVQPQIIAKGTTPMEPDMGSELALAQSSVIRDIAASRLRVDPAGLTGLSAAVPLNTHVVHFAYTAGTARTAMLYTQAFADAYVDYENAQASKTNAHSPTPGVITPATLPAAPSSPNHQIDLGVAVIVGIVVGLGAAWVRDRFDDRPRNDADLERATGLPVLGVIPRVRTRGLDPAAQLELLTAPSSPAAAAFHDLRRVIRRLADEYKARTLLVTGTRSLEQLPVAAELAIDLVQSYRRVVLVDLGVDDLLATALQPEPARHLLDGVPGLDTDVTNALADTVVPGLLMLTLAPGRPAGDDTTLRRVFRQLRSAADFVVVAGPTPSSAQIGAFAELADLTVLVVDARRSTRTRVRTALGRLNRFESTVVGTVLTSYGRTALSHRHDATPFERPDFSGTKLTQRTTEEA